MHLLEVPLDCFRYLLAFIARDFDYHEIVHEFIRLRLTNRMLFLCTKTQVYNMRLIQSRGFQRGSTTNASNTVVLPVR